MQNKKMHEKVIQNKKKLHSLKCFKLYLNGMKTILKCLIHSNKTNKIIFQKIFKKIFTMILKKNKNIFYLIQLT
jgi:hypothetical protein